MCLLRMLIRPRLMPRILLGFLHLCSVTVQAQSIICIGIQKWCPYRCWHFCTLVQYQYGHLPLPELGFNNGFSTGIGIFVLGYIISIGRGHYWYWHSMVPDLVLAFWHFGSVPVWAHTIIGTVVLYGLCRYWHFCTSVQYRYRYIPLPVLAFNNGSSTGIGICVLWFIIIIGMGHYWYWHSMVPVLVLAFRHFGSVPEWAHTITGTGVSYDPYR